MADPDDEARCKAVLDATVRGDLKKALPLLGEKVILGPALWALVSKDSAALGKNVTFMLPAAEGEVQLPGRVIGSTDHLALLRSKALRAAMKAARSRRPHPASEAERIVFYQMVPHELAGQPVTIAGDRGSRILFWSEGGKIVHLDAIGRYKDATADEKPKNEL